MTVVVAAASKYGATQEIAEAIGRGVFAFRAAEGDFRDWDEIRAWATDIASELHGRRGPIA